MQTSQPEAGIRLLGEVSLTWPRALVVHRQVAYVGEGDTMIAIDLREPSHPVVRGSIDTGTEVHRLHIANDYLYVCCNSPSQIAIDIADPERMALRQPAEMVALLANIEVMTETVSTGDGFAIIRTMHDGEREVIREIALDPDMISDRLYRVILNGDLAVAGNLGGVVLIDMAAEGGPRIVGRHESQCSRYGNSCLPGSPITMNIAYPLLYLGIDAGLEVLDISDPAHPALISEYKGMPGGTQDIEFLGDTLLLSERDEQVDTLPFEVSRIHTIDIRHPDAIRATGVYTAPGYFTSELEPITGMERTYAVLAEQRLLVIQVTPPVTALSAPDTP